MASFGWHTLGTSAYEDERFAVILNVEEGGSAALLPYLDSASNPNPTMGVGFNLRETPFDEVILKIFYPDGSITSLQSYDVSYKNSIESIIAQDWTGFTNTQLRSALDAVMAARAADTNVTYGSKRSTFSFADADEVRDVFDDLAPSYEDEVDNQLGNIPESSERAALFSLAWNNPALLGSNLEAAIDNENRAEAWYEIRYQSNGGSPDAGTAKRRYYESEIFDLYNPGSVDDAEARQIFQMVTRHIAAIEAYDASWGTQVAAATSDYGVTVQTLAQSLDEAKDYLVDAYAPGMAIEKVWVDAYVSVGSGSENNSLNFSTRSEDALFLGGIGNDVIIGGSGDDVIYGEDGNDTINGGGGTDISAYVGDFDEYSIVRGTGTLSVTDNVGTEGTDTLTKIEKLQFVNGTYQDGVFRHASLEGPVADNDTALAEVNQTINIDVKANDRDPDGQTLTVALETQAANGTATLQGNGTFNYTPGTNFSGTDSFVYKITDGDNQVAYATVSIIVSNSALSNQNGDGNDNYIVGTSGANTIDAGGGADVVYGYGGDDILFGGTGNDSVYGGDGNDDLQGGTGNDNLYGGAGNDSFTGNDGTENLFGGSGADEYHFNLSTVSGWAGINEDDAQGLDVIYLTNVSAGDRIEFEYNTGTGQLDAFYYADEVGGPDFSFSIDAAAALAGEGVEYIVIDNEKAYRTSNIIAAADYETGNTFVFDIEAYEADVYPVLLQTSAEAPAPVQFSSSVGGGVSLYAGWGTHGSVFEYKYAEVLYHKLTFQGEEHPDGPSEVVAFGYIKDFILHPGIYAEDVRLTVNSSDNATISIHLESLGVTYDWTYFENGYQVTGWTLSTSSSSNIGSVVGNNTYSFTLEGESIEFEEEPEQETFFFERIVFSNGDVINLMDVIHLEGTDAAETLYGMDRDDKLSSYGGADTVYAYAGDDTLIGGLGVDNLHGGDGDDIYTWEIGEGNDTLHEGGGTDDLINIGAGIGAEDVRFERIGGGDSLTVHLSGEKLTLDDHFYNDVYGSGGDGYRFEALELADGTVFNLLDNMTFKGTTGNDNVYGATFQQDTLIGLSGADTLRGYGGNDILNGGTGVDSLRGGEGADTYVWAVGDGNDTIIEEGGTDTITIGSGITAADVRFERVGGGDDLTIHLGSEKLVLSDHFYNDVYGSGGDNYRIEELELYDTTTFDLLTSSFTFKGTSSNENVYGLTLQSDTLIGLGGADTLRGYGGNDTLNGGTGVDTLYGGQGADTYVWAVGDGNDTIIEEGGTDTITIGSGITAADVRFERVGGGDTLTIHLGSEKLTLSNHFYNDVYGSGGDNYRIEELELYDTTTFDLLTSSFTFKGTSSNENVYGLTLQSDTLIGLGGADTLRGYGGNDILNGGTGVDSLRGGEGADTYVWAVGDGNDTIIEEGGTDTITIGSGITAADVRFERVGGGDDLTIHLGSEKLVLSDHFYNDVYGSGGDNYRIEELELYDTTTFDLLTSSFTFKGTSSNENVYGLTLQSDTLIGLGGADTLRGYGGNDTLNGGTGVDTLYGGQGADTYVWAVGDGNDTIIEEGGTDTITIGSGITAADVRFERVGGGDTLTIHLGSEKLTLSNHFYNDVYGSGGDNYRIEELELYDTTTFDLLTSSFTFTGTSTGENVYGLNLQSDTLIGLGGNDTLRGYGGNDTLYGDGGLDTLYGGSGADTFMLEATEAFANIDVIADFNVANDNDVLDISDILDATAYNHGVDAITDWVEITTSGSNSVVKIDRDGTGGTYTMTQVATLQSITGLTDEAALVTSGNLLAA